MPPYVTSIHTACRHIHCRCPAMTWRESALMSALLVNSPLTELPLLSTAFEYAINHFGPNRLGSRLRLRLTSLITDTPIDVARKQLNRLVSVVGVVFSAATVELYNGSLHTRVCIEDAPQTVSVSIDCRMRTQRRTHSRGATRCNGSHRRHRIQQSH